MIYITGNTHGDINRFETEQTKKFTSEDYLIICGDFGFIWNGGKKEEKQLERLSQKPYTILFVDGTHENFDLLNAYPTKRWNQGTVHEIRPNILHLMRGEIFEIDGHSIFAFGGGETEEKEVYMETGRWWPEEMPTRQEMIVGAKHLFNHQLTVDYIITHEPCPNHVVSGMRQDIHRSALHAFFAEKNDRKEPDMMKILHTSDWHLGKMIYGRSLLQDQAHFLKEVFLPTVQKEQPDCVILAGDIFDRQIAPVEAIRMFDKVLTEMSRLQIPFAVISGNHDGADRIAVGASMLRSSGIYIATKLEDVFSPVVLTKGSETLHLYLLPYIEPADVRQYFQDESIQGFPMAYQAVLSAIQDNMDQNAINILVGHCFAAGSQTCDSESAVYVGGSGEVPPSLFQSFDYTALGHLHGPQRVGEYGRYCGSPLKYSFDEEHHKKSLTLLDITKQSNTITLLPIPTLRDMRTVTGTLEELITLGKTTPSEDYLAVELTNDTPVYMPLEQLRPYFPNVLSVHCNWLHTELSGEQKMLRQTIQNRTINEMTVFSQFLQQICGTEPTKEDEALFQTLFTELKEEQANS